MVKGILDDMGLVVSDEGAMMYGWGHGWFRSFPMWWKKAICHVWNRVACFLRSSGHSKWDIDMYRLGYSSGPPKCSFCMAPIKIDGRYVSKQEAYDTWPERASKQKGIVLSDKR